MNNSGMEYLAMQAGIGITRHIGGMAASQELLTLCHIADARNVLNVGCGIGSGAVDVAQRYGCHVVGIDLLPAMLGWAQRRACSAGVQGQIEFSSADVLHLPFPDDSFDVVYAESVLLFVADKAQAIQECIRVTRPGGFVGLNEGFLREEIPADVAAKIHNFVGPNFENDATWRQLWETAALRTRTMTVYPIDVAGELKSRVQCGWSWFLRAEGRAARLYATDPAARRAMNAEFAAAPIAVGYGGYALYAGMK